MSKRTGTAKNRREAVSGYVVRGNHAKRAACTDKRKESVQCKGFEGGIAWEKLHHYFRKTAFYATCDMK